MMHQSLICLQRPRLTALDVPVLLWLAIRMNGRGSTGSKGDGQR